VFHCEGGPNHGDPCIVDAVTSEFGGTSYDCAPTPAPADSVSGGDVIILDMTTGATSLTASLPCADDAVRSHPSRGSGKCTDTQAPCSSNADCKRCTGDPSTTCSDSEECAGKGQCAAAPFQPITCGYWCHCGFCDDGSGRACSADEECGLDSHCVASTDGDQSPQTKPNACELDMYMCGLAEPERCEATTYQACSLAPYRSCSADDTCTSVDAGVCQEFPSSCFGPVISREGDAAPVGGHCSNPAATPCLTNSDCEDSTICLQTSISSTSVGLFCARRDDAPLVSSSAGTPGPVAFTLRSVVEFCYCGDSGRGCSEECDDGNATSGDGCDSNCQVE
jgi:cysteine-rich repeat protein